MEITRTIDCACRVDARLTEDGDFTLAMRGQAPYSADGIVTVEVAVDDKLADRVRAALQAVVDQHHDEVARKADDAAGLERARFAERGAPPKEIR